MSVRVPELADIDPGEYGATWNGRTWRFGIRGYPHTDDEARQIVRACLLLEVGVTDQVTSEAWLRLVERVAALERKIAPQGSF